MRAASRLLVVDHRADWAATGVGAAMAARNLVRHPQASDATGCSEVGVKSSRQAVTSLSCSRSASPSGDSLSVLWCRRSSITLD